MSKHNGKTAARNVADFIWPENRLALSGRVHVVPEHLEPFQVIVPLSRYPMRSANGITKLCLTRKEAEAVRAALNELEQRERGY